MTRGTGKTLAMVKALPEGSAVIVHSYPMANYIRHMIVDVRGIEFAKTINIKVLGTWEVINSLRGFRGHIAVDHWVLERYMTDRERETIFELEQFLRSRPPHVD